MFPALAFVPNAYRSVPWSFRTNGSGKSNAVRRSRAPALGRVRVPTRLVDALERGGRRGIVIAPERVECGAGTDETLLNDRRPSAFWVSRLFRAWSRSASVAASWESLLSTDNLAPSRLARARVAVDAIPAQPLAGFGRRGRARVSSAARVMFDRADRAGATRPCAVDVPHGDDDRDQTDHRGSDNDSTIGHALTARQAVCDRAERHRRVRISDADFVQSAR